MREKNHKNENPLDFDIISQFLTTTQDSTEMGQPVPSVQPVSQVLSVQPALSVPPAQPVPSVSSTQPAQDTQAAHQVQDTQSEPPVLSVQTAQPVPSAQTEQLMQPAQQEQAVASVLPAQSAQQVPPAQDVLHLNLAIPKEQHDALKVISALKQMSLTKTINAAIDEYINNNRLIIEKYNEFFKN